MEKEFIVIFYNRFACQTQTFTVAAKNAFRAGRKFYKEYPRKKYLEAIESIKEVQ